jgi:membrane protein
MARIQDFPHVVKKIGYVTLAKRVWQQIGEDNVFTWGSALAYSWIFAVFPFFIFLLSLVPLVPTQMRQNFKPTLAEFIDKSIPSNAAAQIIKEQALPILDKPSSGGFLSVGLILALWAASGGMSMTMSALDKAYDIDKPRGFVKHRLVAMALTIGTATLIILVMILLPIGGAVLTWLANHGAAVLHVQVPSWLLFLIDLVRYVFALVILIAVTSMIYHFGPNLKQKFHAVTPGAVFSIAVWLTLGVLFKIYLSKLGGAQSYNKTYGAVAGLVILLLFFYFDGLVLLVGAEINSELDFAAAGLPSGETPEERAVAPVPTPENKALKEELLESRSEKAGAPPDAVPPEKQLQTTRAAAAASPPPPRPRGSMSKLVLGLGALWAATKIAQVFARCPPVAPPAPPGSRLPLTRELIEQQYGVELNGRSKSRERDGVKSA